MSHDPHAPPPPAIPAPPTGGQTSLPQEYYETHDTGASAYYVPGMPTDILDTEAETENNLERQRRNQKFVAIGVAIGIHAVIALIVTLIVVTHFQRKVPEIIAVTGEDVTADDLQKKTIQVTRQTPTASANKVSRVLASNAVSTISVPVVEDIINDDPVEFGNLGEGLGVGLFGDGGMGTYIPSAMSKRCSHKDREKRLAESGGKPESEEAVLKGLRWLKSQQNEDGSFGRAHRAAMTGIVLLAYLGHCETPDSKEFGDSCLNAILWLVELGMKNDGRLSEKRSGNQWVYEHGIASYALAEAYSITKYGKRKIPRTREILMKSIPIIIEGQQPGGGFDYDYRKGNRVDLSVAGWQIQALKAAQHSKLKFDGLNTALDNAMKYLRSQQGPRGGFGYSGPGDSINLAGAGALGLIMGTGNPRDRAVKKAVDFIVDSTKHNYNDADLSNSLYGWYYNTQACFQVGGSKWTQWNNGFQDELIKNQGENGLWKPEGHQSNHGTSGAGPDQDIFRTALCCLMLEVYYRYLPATETKAPLVNSNPLGF